MKRYLVIAAAAAGFAAPAFGQALDFDSVDAGNTGAVTYEEARAVFPHLDMADFERFDTTGSGDLNEAEWILLVEDFRSAD